MADGEQGIERGDAAAGTAKGRSERLELGKRGQSSARRLAESKATIPHGYTGRRVELGRDDLAEAVVIRALGRALRARSDLNCAYRDGGIERYSRVNVAVTVETDDGPLMPTLFDADEMEVDAIADRVGQLTERARLGELTQPELSGATVTIGSAGDDADFLAGSVTPGQALHLGVGRPVQADGATEVQLMLSFDQRAIRPPEAGALLGLIAEAAARPDATVD